jgi:hypothetical protein
VTVQGPYIVSEPPLISGGVDFLGLRQANLDLMAEAIPGINNVTRYVRPFSLMAWITWKYRDLAAGIPRVAHDKIFPGFRERAETLFTWSHWINGRRDLVGMRSFHPPIGADGKAPLDFASWRRQPNNTSYFAAVQYGPASKEGTGLGILKSAGPRMPLQPTSLGENLAKALDKRLRRRGGYDRLFGTLDKVRASEREASDLYVGWSISSPSAEERELFKAAISPNEPDPTGRRRSEIIARVQALVADHGPISIETLRKLLASRPGPPVIDSVQTRWLALQLRQAQRLGFEVLFHELESIAIRSGPNRTKLTNEILDAITTSVLGPRNKTCVGDWLKWCSRRWPDTNSLLHNIEGTDAESLIALTEKAHSLVGEKDLDKQRESVGLAFLLLMIVVHSILILRAKESGPLTRLVTIGNGTGSRDRYSLLHWAETSDELKELPLSKFLDSLLFDELLSRHIFTASRRADGSSNRLRVSYDGRLWTTFVSQPAAVSVTPDRLAALASLMNDCNLLPKSQIVFEQ